MSFELSKSMWNAAVKVYGERDLSYFEDSLTFRFRPVFDGVPNLLYAGNNIVLKLHPGSGKRVASVILIAGSGVFKGSSINTFAAPPFTIIGCSVPCSAQKLLECVRSRDATGLELSTEIDRYTLYYGGALSFMFVAAEDIATSPEASVLTLIEYSYGTPYYGSLPPDIT